MKSKNIKALLQALPIYKNKIRPWLNGKTIEDAPKCGPKAVLYTDTEGLAFHGPFAMVTLERSGDGWLARVSGNANPATAHYANTDEALKRWAASVWHTAIRGVIVLMLALMVAGTASADDRREHGVRKVSIMNGSSSGRRRAKCQACLRCDVSLANARSTSILTV